jgi:response regulator RpfG family c-di-GMP phosphodiesterase
LTPKERTRLRAHPIIGAKYLEALAKKHEEYQGLAPIAKYHHEHFGGISILTHPKAKYPGYPGELSGKAIPLEARITAVGDSFDAMTTDRGYKPKMSIHKALEEMKRCSGLSYDRNLIPNRRPDAQFDPEIIEAFLSIRTMGSSKTKVAHVLGCKHLFETDSLDIEINPSGFENCECVNNPPEFIEYEKAA